MNGISMSSWERAKDRTNRYQFAHPLKRQRINHVGVLGSCSLHKNSFKSKRIGLPVTHLAQHFAGHPTQFNVKTFCKLFYVKLQQCESISFQVKPVSFVHCWLVPNPSALLKKSKTFLPEPPSHPFITTHTLPTTYLSLSTCTACGTDSITKKVASNIFNFLHSNLFFLSFRTAQLHFPLPTTMSIDSSPSLFRQFITSTFVPDTKVNMKSKHWSHSHLYTSLRTGTPTTLPFIPFYPFSMREYQFVWGLGLF